MGDESSCKVYVSTAAEFSADGFLRPLWIIWEDGRRFDIDRVVHVERAASRESGRCRSALYGDDRRKKTSSVL